MNRRTQSVYIFEVYWSEEIIVIGYNLVSFLHNFKQNISVLKNAMFYLIII